jgi:chromosome segregation ATPase
MITLSQMQLLEQKIESAIAKISALSDENNMLRASCDSIKSENDSLVAKLDEFQANQSKIEQGILKALQRLEFVENTIVETARVVSESPVPPAKPASYFAPEVQSEPGAEPDEIESVEDEEEEEDEEEVMPRNDTQIGGPAQQLDIF